MKFKRILSALLAFSVVMTSWADIDAAAESGTEVTDTNASEDGTDGDDAVIEDDSAAADEEDDMEVDGDEGESGSTTDEGTVDSFEVTIDENDTLSWTAVADAVSYKVYCKMGENSYEIDASDYIVLGNIAKLNTLMDNKNCIPGEYTIEVYAEKTDSTTMFVGSTLYTFYECPDFVRLGNSETYMSWTAIEGSTGYRVEVSNNTFNKSHEFSTNNCEEFNEIFFDDVNLPGDTYNIKIYSKNSSGIETLTAKCIYLYIWDVDVDSENEISWKEVEGADHYVVYGESGDTIFAYDCFTNKTLKHMQYFADFGCPDTCQVDIYWVNADASETGLIGSVLYDSSINDSCKVWDPKFSYDDTTGMLSWEDYNAGSAYDIYANEALIASGNSEICLPMYLASYYCTYDSNLKGDLVISVKSTDGYSASDYYFYNYDGCDAVTTISAPANLKAENGEISWDSVDGAVGYVSEFIGPFSPYPFHVTSYVHMPVNIDSILSSWGYEGTYEVKTCAIDINGDRSEFTEAVTFEYVKGSEDDDSEQTNSWSPDFAYDEATGMLTWNNGDPYLTEDVVYSVIANGTNILGIGFNGEGERIGVCLPYALAFHNFGNNINPVTGDLSITVKCIEKGYESEDYYTYSYDGCDVVTSIAAPANHKLENGMLTWDGVDGAVAYITEFSCGEYSFKLGTEEYNSHNMETSFDGNAPSGTYEIRTCAIDINGDRSEFTEAVTFEYVNESEGNDSENSGDDSEQSNTWSPNFVYNEATGQLSWDACDEIQSGNNMYYLYADENSMGSTWGNSANLPVLFASSAINGNNITGDFEIKVTGDLDYDSVADYTADATYPYSYDGCDVNENLAKVTNVYLEEYDGWAYARTEAVENAVGYIFEFKNGDTVTRANSTGSGGGYGYIGYSYFWDMMGLTNGGDYQVRVCAVDINGDRSEFSDYFTFTYIPTAEDDAESGTGGESSEVPESTVQPKYEANGEFTFAFNDYGLNTGFDEVDIAQYGIKETDIVTVTANYSGEKDVSDLSVVVSARTSDWNGYSGVWSNANDGSFTLTTTVKDVIEWNILEGKFDSFEDASHLVFSFWYADDSDEGITISYEIKITSATWTPNFVYDETTGQLSWDNYEGTSGSTSNSKEYILYANDTQLSMVWAWSFDNGATFTAPSLHLPMVLALKSLEGSLVTGDFDISITGDNGNYTGDTTLSYSYDGCDVNENLGAVTSITIDEYSDYAMFSTNAVENAVGYIYEFKNGDKVTRNYCSGQYGMAYIGYSYFWDLIDLANGGDYQVRACAVDINGDISEFSDYFTFTYTPVYDKYRSTGTQTIKDKGDGTTDTTFLRIYNTDYAFSLDDVIDVTITYDGSMDVSDWTVVAMGFDHNWSGWNAKFGRNGTLRLTTTVERIMDNNGFTDISSLYGIDLSIWHVDPAFAGESFDYDVRILDKDNFEYPEPARIEIPEGYSFYETGTLTVTPDEEYGVFAKFPWVQATEYAFDENDEITVSFDYNGELDATALKAAVFGFTEDYSGWNGLYADSGHWQLSVTVKELMEHNSITDVSDLYGICGDIWDLTTDFIGETFTYTVAIKPADVDSRDITKAVMNDGVLMENIADYDKIVVKFRPDLITECGHEHHEEELAINDYCTWAGINFAGVVSGGVMGYDPWLQPDSLLCNSNINGESREEFEFTIMLDYYRQCMENDHFFEEDSIIEKLILASWNGEVVSITAEKDTREVLTLTYDNGPVAVTRIDNDWFVNGSIQGDYHLNTGEIVREVTTIGELREKYKTFVYDGFTFESDTVGGTADDYNYCLYFQTKDLNWVSSDRIALGETISWKLDEVALEDSAVIIDYGVQFGFNTEKGMSETVDALEFGDVFIINPSENSDVSIELDCEEITIYQGQTFTLLATVLPEDSEYSDITWSSGDYRIASVNPQGVVWASEIGTVKIAATAGNATAYCVVTVVEAPEIEAPEVSIEVDNDSVFLVWEEVEGAVEYKVYRSLTDGGEKELLATTASLVYTDILEEDGEYYYYVTAVDAEGTESLYSLYAIADIIISARTPSNIVLEAADGAINVKWDAESRAEKYKLCLYIDGVYTLISDSITATEYTVTNLQPGYEYGVIVLSYSNGGWSSFEEEDIQYIAPKGSFTPVVSSAVSNGKVTLSWNKVSGATSYRVYRANSATGTKTRLGIITQTSFVDSGVSEGKTYYYFVQAYNTNTKTISSYSGAITAVIPYSAPATPTISSATAAVGSATVTWKKVSGATSYRIYRADSATGAKTFIKAVTTSSFTDTSVTAGNTYYYFVTAYSSTSGLASGYSAAKSVTVPKPVTPLAKPVVTVVSGGGNATLTWDAIPDATSYRVFRATTLGGARTLVKVRTSTYFIDNTVKAGSTYYYYVLAYNANNGAKSSYSAVKSIKIVNTFNVTPVIKTGNTGNNSATLSWNVVPGATSYRIYRLYNGRRTLLASQSMTEYVDKSVTNGNTYIYQIKAYSATTKGLTDYSNKKTLKIMPAPTITGANVLGKLTWSSVSGATSYRIYRATSLTGAKTLIKTVNSTTYTDTTAKDGSLYYYFVAAYDSKTGTLTDYSAPKTIKINK